MDELDQLLQRQHRARRRAHDRIDARRLEIFDQSIRENWTLERQGEELAAIDRDGIRREEMAKEGLA